jgi:hypothetical protein
MSTRQPACAKVGAAAIATRTPDETARLHLAEVLGHVEACPWWAGQVRSPGLNGRLPRMVLCPWSGVLTMTILRASWPSPGRTAGDLACVWM